LVSKIDSHLEDPALKVQSHLKAGEQASRLVLYFTDFLSLAGLVVLFLSVIGVYFLFQSYLNSQTSTIAIFKSLGMIPRKIQAIYFLFFLFHSLMAFLLALLFVNSLLPFMNLFLKEVAFFDLSFKLSKVSLILSFFILLVLTVFLSWPVLKALDKVRVKSLFNDQVSVHSLLSFKKVLLHVPLFLFFGVLSVWLANSWHTGGIFWSSLILIMFITGLAWLGFCEVLTKYLLPKNLSWHFKSWLRRPVPTLLVFLAMSMSLLLINFLIYTENQLHRELLFTGANGRPSLFIFDIQEEQLTDLQLVAKQNNFKYNSIAPMIRAKLTKVNGRNFEKLKDEEVFKTRESEREQRFRNRGMNLTYREKLSSSESLIS
ncbi:MAG: hypothetical protein KDD40_12980, partial [Bdellovibrionales bacterium]|nr:hypothetical protein [Bdellovibrionales bacterium]